MKIGRSGWRERGREGERKRGRKERMKGERNGRDCETRARL